MRLRGLKHGAVNAAAFPDFLFYFFYLQTL